MTISITPIKKGGITVASLAWNQGVALSVSIAFFPQPAVLGVVSIPRYESSAVVLHFDESVVAVVAVLGGLASRLLLREVAVLVVAVAGDAALSALPWPYLH